jgi:RHS repeat-associated protein
MCIFACPATGGDDVTMTLTKSNIIQYNACLPKPRLLSGRRQEYYPFACPPERKRRRGLQTANSWTRENVTGNNFLANGGTELNPTTSLYDLDYRHYDPILGRMNGVDPMATKYASLSPYNYSFNDPVTFNDPTGADPNYNFGGVYYTGGYYTYDDYVPNGNMGEYFYTDTRRVYRGYGYSLAFGYLPYAHYGLSATSQIRQDAMTLGLNAFAAKYGEPGELYETWWDTKSNGRLTDSEFLGYKIKTLNGETIWSNVRMAEFFLKIEEFIIPDFMIDNGLTVGNAGYLDDDSQLHADKLLIYGYYADAGFSLEYDNTTRGFFWMKLEVNTFKKNGYSFIVGKNGHTSFSIAYKHADSKHEFHISQHGALGIPGWREYASRVMISEDFIFNSKSDAIIGVRQGGIRSVYHYMNLNDFGPTGIGHIRTTKYPRQ